VYFYYTSIPSGPFSPFDGDDVMMVLARVRERVKSKKSNKARNNFEMLILSKQMNKDLFYPKALSLHWLRSVAGNVSDYPKYIHTHTAILDTKLLFYAKHLFSAL
jgi:hypothetical protein